MNTRHIRIFSYLAIIALLFLAACGDPSEGELEENQNAGEQNQTSNQTNQSSNQTNQTSNQTNQTSNGCNDVCTLGGSRCTAEGAQTCVSVDGCPRWSDAIACGTDEVCSGGQCASECQQICTLGDRECVGEQYRVCEENVDGCADWSTPSACNDGQTCSGGQCGESCTDACDAGELRCDNASTFQVCEEQSSGCLDWSVAEACPAGASCSDGLCEGCADGERRCSTDGTSVEQCSADLWSAVQSCPLGCDNAVCASEVSCTPGNYQCNGNVVQVCNASGSAYLHVSTCAVDCENGLCTGQCEPGERRCNGDNVEVCNAGGTAWDFSQSCDDTRCVSTVAICAEESLDITTDTDLDGTIYVDGPVIVRSGVDLYSPTGNLRIIAQTITVEEGGSITAAATGDQPEGRGRDGAECGSNFRGGTGGSHATQGGSSTCFNAPPAFARSDEIRITPGSRGGYGHGYTATEGLAGYGGGLIELIADDIDVQGSLRADGQDGVPFPSTCGGGNGGGGSGGGILVAADDLSFSGTVSVLGGQGSTVSCSYNNSGNGGNGVVKFLHASSFDNTGSISGTSFSGLLAPLHISSTTHPEADRFYNDDFDTIAISWVQPFPSLQGYYLALNATRNFVPAPANSDFLDDEVITYSREDVVDGANYFHITAVNAQFTVGTMEARRTINVNTYPPSVFSSSHAQQHQWSSNANAFMEWTDHRGDSDLTGYYYVVDHFGDTVPTANDTFVPIDQKQTLLSNLPDGIWAFHIVSVDTMGYLTSTAGTYRVRIGDDPGTGSILGTIRDENNDPLSGARVTVNRGLLNPAVPDGITNSNGQYNMGDVPAGEWEVQISADGYVTQTTTITLSDGQARTVDITLAVAP